MPFSLQSFAEEQNGALYVWQLNWVYWCWMWIIGHSKWFTSPTNVQECLIQDLAAELDRKPAVALRSHKQDIRDTLSQYTHTGGRGVGWGREMAAQAHPHPQAWMHLHTHKHWVQLSYSIYVGLLLTQQLSHCVITSVRLCVDHQNRTALWHTAKLRSNKQS